MQKLDESAQAKLLEREHEKEHSHRDFGIAREVVISCVLAIVLMALCFLTLILMRACWGMGSAG